MNDTNANKNIIANKKTKLLSLIFSISPKSSHCLSVPGKFWQLISQDMMYICG